MLYVSLYLCRERGEGKHISVRPNSNPKMTLSFLFVFSLHFMICTVHFVLLTHWLLELFVQTLFLDILEIFRLDIGQSSFNLVKKASATWQRAFLPLASHFTTFWHHILRHFGSGMQLKNVKKSIIKMSTFYHGVATCNGRKLLSEFCAQLFVHISGTIRLSTLIWVLEKSFPPAEVE